MGPPSNVINTRMLRLCHFGLRSICINKTKTSIMPDCTENYENEISDGRNSRNVKCKFCGSVILTPSSATFTNFEFQLPLIKQNKMNAANPATETVSLFWSVNDMFVFQNVGFSNTVGTNKYLTCADCEAGPIGYHDLTSKTSYVALTRVQHS